MRWELLRLERRLYNKDSSQNYYSPGEERTGLWQTVVKPGGGGESGWYDTIFLSLSLL